MQAERPSDDQDEGKAGKIVGLVNSVKGLTITNAVVIIMLAAVAGPAYIIYRAMNDADLLDRFMSHYREITHFRTSCAVREVQLRNGPQAWSVSTGFAYQGSDRWTIAVILEREPDEDDVTTYCATLNLLVDFMRDPAARSPSFPGTDKPVIQMYPDNRG